MIAAVGYAGILVAGISAIGLIVQGARAFSGRIGTDRLRLPAWGIAVGAIVAMGSLELALLTDDFSIEYVARNHSRDTPLVFTIAAGWASLEGSIVLWGLVLSGFMIAVLRSLDEDDRSGSGALAVMGLVALFFFGLMATAANPFTTLDIVPFDGSGANPLLQNHILMAIHPPMLYLGYIGFTVPFAFAISALVAGDGSTSWLQRTRRWTLIAWTFLTLGIVLGAWWSYEVLGWGGYWAWDPVENASLLPWLTATAFIHSSVVQRRRGMLQAWNMALVISTFALTILGTFLTRSGVVASVHSFTQSAIGPVLLVFLVLILVGSFGLFALRAHLVASPPRLDSLASREGLFLLNNLLLAVFAFVVLIGTIYPLVLEAFSGDRVSVGAPWFDRAAIPLSLVLLLAMGLGPLTPYRFAAPDLMWRRIRGPLQAASIVSAGTVLAGVRPITVVATIWLSVFIVSGIATLAHQRARAAAAPYSKALSSLFRADPGFWGGMVSHVGVALLAIGIAFSGSFVTRQTIGFEPGESALFDGYTLTYEGPTLRDEPNRRVIGALFTISRGDTVLGTLEPRLNQYPNQVQPIATPSVRTGLREDVYLSLVRIDSDGVTIDAFRFPLMWLLWSGALLIVAGGGWSFAGRKRRRELSAAKASTVV